MTFGVSLGVPTDSLEEVMLFGVSRGAPTDPLEEVMIFGVSQGAPTYPSEVVEKFLKHIDKDMKTRLTQLEKVSFFVTDTFLSLVGGSQLKNCHLVDLCIYHCLFVSQHCSKRTRHTAIFPTDLLDTA